MFDIIICIAAIVLLMTGQFILSKKDNKWFGLLMPSASVMLSLFYVYLMSELVAVLPETHPIFPAMILFYTFMFANIPTAILLIIYAVGRFRRKNENKHRENKRIL